MTDEPGTILRCLKANETSHDIPVIILSALRASGTRVQSLPPGGLDFISNPFHAWEPLARGGAHPQQRGLSLGKNVFVMIRKWLLKEEKI